MIDGNKPNLTLNMDDKIYLAVSQRDADKLSFVYTLACLKTDKMSNTYNLMATREILTFRNKDFAHLYHDTILEIIDKNMNNKMYDTFFSMNDELITQFYEKSR